MATMTQTSSTALVANNLPIPVFSGLAPIGSLESYIGAVHQIPVLSADDEQALAVQKLDRAQRRVADGTPAFAPRVLR